MAAEKLLARLRLMVMKSIIRQPVEVFDLEESSPGSISTKLSRDLPLIKSVNTKKKAFKHNKSHFQYIYASTID